MTDTTPTKIHPARKKRVAKALRLYSIAAWVTGVWLLVLVTRMICDYILGMEIPAWASAIGPLHGFFYILYLVATVNLTTQARWDLTKAFITALAGTIPFLSFVAEHFRRKEVTQKFELNA
ncbi:integral membrane protein [Corynebacterium pyruviciproducens ATCC BAA-1742]|uniref:Integral membrane protein n=2 Tax=Corynebacterium pyruviciproducens TaxID=598660 RepID=S2Z577_9CORY|nr:DUF3817 domain-containing protein [Corynebacterium pyruviciproducens]EPD69385.1 integral membrane protein [Corynebacterium pyruviciproducens ATCC BAA-1742]MDH4659062.1 DUF3817 domain-containing protein [Corynebacterium pyruviciproducens]MDK7215181.1 DUF3817 domain-containing protein [Corynebacterium pyruviciproducens]WOT02688.1 DUF3817 domain-containing protein [Corynebacterium pyruviciproducens]